MMALQIDLCYGDHETRIAERFANDLHEAGAEVHVPPEHPAEGSPDEPVDVVMVLLSPAGLATPAIREQMQDALVRYERGDVVGLYGIVTQSVDEAGFVAGWARIPSIDATGAYEDALSAVVDALKTKLPIVAARRAAATVEVSARSESELQRPKGRRAQQTQSREPGSEKTAGENAGRSALRVSRRALVRGVAAAGLIAAGAVGVGGVAWLRGRAAPRRPGMRQWYFLTGGLNGSTPVVANGTVYIGSVDKQFYAVDALTGAQRWSTKMTDVVSTSTVADGMIYAASADRLVTALDDATGRIHWRFEVGSASTAAAAANGVAYVVAPDANLYALEARTGLELHKFKTPALNPAISPTLANGTLYVTSTDSLFALNAQTGATRWSSKLTTPVQFSPVTDGSRVYVSRSTSTFSALDAATGATRWDAFQELTSAPVVDSGALYFIGFNALQALSATTGIGLWNTAMNATPYTPAATRGVVYVVSDMNEVSAVNATNGAQRWLFSASGAINAPLAVANGLVYAASGDTALYAILA